MANKRIAALVALAAALLVGSGCGTTRIITEPNARIYVDGELVGRGEAHIRRNGGPGSVLVEVETDDGRKKAVELRRRFTLATLGIGVVTYGIGLIAFWQHHAAVQINLPEPKGGWAKVGASESKDPWSVPPSGWDDPEEMRASESDDRWTRNPYPELATPQPIDPYNE